MDIEFEHGEAVLHVDFKHGTSVSGKTADTLLYSALSNGGAKSCCDGRKLSLVLTSQV
jgi:hypothetical protein